jgi:hypothetical protein
MRQENNCLCKDRDNLEAEQKQDLERLNDEVGIIVDGMSPANPGLASTLRVRRGTRRHSKVMKRQRLRQWVVKIDSPLATRSVQSTMMLVAWHPGIHGPRSKVLLCVRPMLLIC